MNKTLLAAFVLAVSSLGACKTFDAATPPSFAELSESGKYDYRATSADGLVLAVRAEKNDPKGNLSFWSDVIERRLREDDGYTLVSKKPVKAKSGEDGTYFRFSRDVSGNPHTYDLAVFVTEKRVFLVEAGGTKDDMDKYATTVEGAVAGFRIR